MKLDLQLVQLIKIKMYFTLLFCEDLKVEAYFHFSFNLR